MMRLYNLLLFGFVFLLSLSGFGQTTIVAWETNGLSGTTTNLDATTQDSNVENSTLIRGNGLNATSLNDGFAANNWDEDSLGDAVIQEDYFEITVEASSGFSLNLSVISFNFRRSGTGPKNFRWQYSLDNMNFTEIGSEINFTSTPDDGSSFGPIDVTGVSELQNVNSGTTIHLRLYGWNASGSNGTGAIGRLSGSDLEIKGSVSPSGVPFISNISQTPSSSISSSDEVSVSADVTDSNGTINNVELSWGTNPVSLNNNINMSNISGDTYTTDSNIPSQSEGTTVYYEINASDNDLESSTSSEQNYAVLFSLPFTDNFDSLLFSISQGGLGINGNKDYFITTDGSNIDPDYNNTDGEFLAGQDIDDGGWTNSSSPSQLIWSDININGFSDIIFSCDFASEGGGIDDSDFISFEYRVDSGNWNNLIVFVNSDGANSNFQEDTNFDDNGDGIQLTADFTEFTQEFTVSGSSMDIRFTADIDSEGEEFAIDNVSVREPNDQDSKITAPTAQVAPSTIVSDEVNSIIVSEPVLRFDVEDLGSGDGLPTKINQISFVPGPANTADWSDVIQGIRVKAGGTNIAGTETTEEMLNDTEITYSFDFTPPNPNVINNMSVDDGTTKEFEIRVYLNESNIVGGEVIQLQIEQNNTKFQTKNSGSALETTFDAAITGNQHTISIPSRAFSFVQQPQTTIINENMNSDVQVAYVDNNGNVNNEETTDIKITSGGSMIGDPITEVPVDGISTFTINHDALDTNIKLTASTSIPTISNLDSNNFSIIEAVQLFITEVVDPDESGGDGKYVEIFNAGISSIDFSNIDYYIVREANGGNSISNVQLTGQIEPKGYYAIDEGNFNTKYGISSNLTDDSGSFPETISGNGDDSYFISTNVDDGNDGRNSVIDIYGVIGVDGTGETWEYEDSRAYRLNPEIKNASSVWDNTEWQITTTGDIATIEPTPKYGDQDYVYVDDTNGWGDIGLGDPTSTTSTENQNIFIRSGNVTFDKDVTIGDLVVRTGASLTIESDVVLTVKGDIVNEGEIIFKSDSGNTAVLGEMGSTSRVVGEGFQIERYVPATSRSFRYLSSSVNTPGTINDNWQEGATSASENPHPGFGTHITGSSTGANGLDQTSTGNNSLFQWNENSQSWNPINSTNQTADTLVTGDAFAMLIRGDRSTSLNSNTALGPPTTLRATGTIVTGDVEIGVDVGELGANQGDFSLVGNPYQAQVDLQKLLKENNTDLSSQFVYIYDPNITDNGGYATIDLGANVGDVVNATPTNSSGGTDANKFLQPNQAFFVETTATSPSPSLTFTESIKSTQTTNVDTFSDDDLSTDQFISINLYDDDEQSLKDGVRVKFSSDYSNQINHSDAPKLWNNLELFAIVNDADYLAIESRAIPQQDEVVNLYTGNYQSANYHFEINVHEMDYAEVQLYDAYQDSYTDLSSGVNSVAFSVDAAIPESVAGDRFQLVFDEITFSIDEEEATSLQVYPNPVTNNRLHITGLPEFSSDNEVRLQLYDILGQEVYQESITTFQQDQEIKLPELSAGNYLLQLTSGQQTQNIHLLVK